jgi:nitrogen fixation protein
VLLKKQLGEAAIFVANQTGSTGMILRSTGSREAFLAITFSAGKPDTEHAAERAFPKELSR